MKKIFLLFAAVGVFIACDPVHEKIDNGSHISVEELIKQSKVIVDKVSPVAGQKTYTASKDAPITLIENIDVTDCDGVTVYFDANTVADAYWKISVAGGEAQEILRNAGFFRYKVPEGTTNLSNIVLTHTENTETNTITVKGIYVTYGAKVAPSKQGLEFGNVITCETAAPVNAKWDIGGKEFLGNFATKKMKVNWDDNGDYVPTDYVVTLTALCPDGTKLVAEYPVQCDKISDPLIKYYIYGDPNRTEDEKKENPQEPFTPGAWNSDMRFSSTEGAHLPTISDDVYFGLKTLIFDIADATPDLYVVAINGWWNTTYYDPLPWKNGLNELQITPVMADECAKGGSGNGGPVGRDLMPQVRGGSMTLKTVYYEE